LRVGVIGEQESKVECTRVDGGLDGMTEEVARWLGGRGDG
jgi:hypothetical protein